MSLLGFLGRRRDHGLPLSSLGPDHHRFVEARQQMLRAFDRWRTRGGTDANARQEAQDTRLAMTVLADLRAAEPDR